MKKHLFIFLLLSLNYCSKESTTQSESLKKDSTLITNDSLKETNNSLDNGTLNKEKTLKTLNNEILSVLKSKDYAKLANYIHPDKGVQFSMYAYVKPKKDKHFTKEDFNKYVATNIKFTWGEKDGTGDPLVLSIKDYLNQWVFKRDFGSSRLAILAKFCGLIIDKIATLSQKLSKAVERF